MENVLVEPGKSTVNASYFVLWSYSRVDKGNEELVASQLFVVMFNVSIPPIVSSFNLSSVRSSIHTQENLEELSMSEATYVQEEVKEVAVCVPCCCERVLVRVSSCLRSRRNVNPERKSRTQYPCRIHASNPLHITVSFAVP